MGGLVHPHLSLQFSLEQGLNQGLIDTTTRQSLSELERALLVVKEINSSGGPQLNALPVSAAAERGLITEEECLRILELQMNTGGLRTSEGQMVNLKEAEEKRLLTLPMLAKLRAKLCQELVDPNTAEQLNFHELRQRCVSNVDSGLLLLPVQQQPGGTVCLSSGKKVSMFHAVQEGLIDRNVGVRLLEAQLFAGGIADPRSGHRLAVHEAVHHGLMDQDLACALFARQLKNGGILDSFSGDRLDLEESIHRNLISPRLALVVLESLCAFSGILWPDSGEIIPIADAFQRGVISEELSRNILRHRHAIEAVYNPETFQLLSLTQTAEYLDPSAAIYLKDIHIPDVLPSRNQSFKSEFDSSSLDSACFTPLSLPLLPSGFPEAFGCDATPTHSKDESRHRLLSHIFAHSYVDAHSGKRLLLLDPELNDVIKANILVHNDFTDAKQSTSSTNEQEKLKIVEQLNLADQGQQTEADHKESVEFEKNDTSAVERNNKSLYNQSSVESDIDLRVAKEESKFFNDESLASPKKLDGPELNADLNATSSSMNLQSTVVKDPQNLELEKLAQELKQEGLLNLDGNKLLPDEAVAQGLLSGYMAVKLMAEANLFGGFLDASSGTSLTVDDVTQGLVDEDLMWRVLKSDKTLSGVFDVEKNCVCSITQAGQTGLLDPDTTVRLLEAQVVSGGIVDPRRSEKMSVTTAAKLGLIEENQKEELMVLESAYEGKNVDLDVSLIKASLQLQMDGVVDPETKSPVPLEQAIQNKLIKPDEAYKVLTKQVAEGGIVHHASGLRFSVSDAVDRGLVDRSVASGLQELEWIFKGKICSSSHPDAVALQASTGAISDPESRRKLTLTEAVSKGLLEDSVADKAMRSSVVTRGVLDPQSACIVPFSELVKQGRIDINTGQRFLTVKPFRGIRDEKTGEKITLREAVVAKKVDPVPSFRLLQSQANSGGIVDITTGERLSLLEACKRGLIEDNIVRLIAINQFLEGGIVDPFSGSQASSLDDAVAQGLISSQIASDILADMTRVEVEDDEGSSTPFVSKSSNSVDSVDTARKELSPELIRMKSECIPEHMQKVQVKIKKSDLVEKCVQAYKEKDLLQAQKSVGKTESGPSDESKISMFHEPDDGKVTDFLAEEIKDEMEKGDTFVEIREIGKGDMAEKQDDNDLYSKEKPAKIQFRIDDELPDQQETSTLTAGQNKNKKKKKKDKKVKESTKEAQINRKEPSETDQVDTHMEGQSDATEAVRDDPNSKNKPQSTYIYSQETHATSSDINIAGNDSAKQGFIAGLALECKSDSQKHQVRAASANNAEKGEKNEELKKQEEKGNEVEEKPSVSQETEEPQTSQDIKKRKEMDLPPKHVQPNEKAAPTLKAKESLLQKDFVEGVSEEKTANEPLTSDSELGKESQHPAAQGVTIQTLPELNGKVTQDDEDASSRKHHGSPLSDNTALSKESYQEPSMVKATVAVESASENRATETFLLETSSNEKGQKRSSEEDIQEKIMTTQLVLSTEKDTEAPYRKQRKKNKNKNPKVRDARQKLLPPENRGTDMTMATNSLVDKTNLDQSAKLTTGQSASGIVKPLFVDKATKTAINPQNSFHSPSDLHQSEESTSRTILSATGQEQFAEFEKRADFSQDALKSDFQLTAQFAEFGAQSDKTTSKMLKMQQPPQGSHVLECKSGKDQKLNSEELAEDNSKEYETTNPECDSATNSCEEENVKKDSDNMNSNTRTSSKIRKVTNLFIICELFFL